MSHKQIKESGSVMLFTECHSKLAVHLCGYNMTSS